MMEIDKRKLGRIYRGIHSKSWIMYPDDRFRSNWDLVITLLIIMTCGIGPYTLAFQNENGNAL